MSANPPFSGDPIAACALQHYKSLPKHGKPRLGQEWTIYAALVVASSSGAAAAPKVKPYVLCSATGSKCTTTGPDDWCLRDLHAEVLVKRGFQKLLWQEIRSGTLKVLLRETKPRNGDLAQSSAKFFHLDPDIQLHLYVSDSPCGDATIYKLDNGDMNFTGAKLIVADGDSHTTVGLSCHDHATTVTREAVQHLGQLRIKSGRSNLPSHLRSTSLSCSDKLLKWALLGLQGRALSEFIAVPIRLTSIVVSRDPHSESMQLQEQALKRAILDRRNQVIAELEENEGFRKAHSDFFAKLKSDKTVISVVDEVFESAKSQLVVPFQKPALTTTSDSPNENGKRTMSEASESSKSKQKVSPCGFCLNWQIDGEGTEVLVGARGTKQGKKATGDADYIKRASRLCRHNLQQFRVDNSESEVTTSEGGTSLTLSTHMIEARNAIFATTPLKGWVKSGR
jgi:hypothetical protein